MTQELQPGPTLRPSLTPHQERIARLSAKGLTDVGIAALLGCSTATVQYHKQQARARLGGLSWRQVVQPYYQ